MTATKKLRCRTWWVLLPLLVAWGCAGAYSPQFYDSSVKETEGDLGFAFPGSDVIIGGGDSFVGGSDVLVGDSGVPPCQPDCVGKACGAADGCGATCSLGSGCCTPDCSDELCGASDGCGGTCKAGSGCCTPDCSSKLCGASDGCGATCKAGSGCCTPDCAGKTCGASDGCGGTCAIGSGCSTTCATWQAVNPDDPWDDSDPNYDGERSCNGSLIKDFGRVSLQANCLAKCEGVAATCCFRDHRGDHKSCKAYDGKVVVVSSCTGCTAASCK